jgi:predicted ATPase/DNA-binding SARP family transcriptional activator/Tfp pilus assembly protein PilF
MGITNEKPSSSQLKLRLLGPPQVELDGKKVEIKRRKALALLVYLAVSLAAHTRETLATLLWPEHDHSKAFAYLRTTLWTLNKALGESWLQVDREMVAIAPEANLWVDAHVFSAAFRKGESQTPANITRLIEAVELYQGDFLAGFNLPDSPAFDEWQFFERERLQSEFSELLDTLVENFISTGEFESAIPYARRRLALDNLHEPAHRQLLSLFAWSGQRSAALRQYNEFVALLDTELGVSPEPQTTDLYQAILEKRLPPPTTAQPSPQPESRYRARRSHLPPQATGFVGREIELDAITEMLAETNCRLVSVVGPGGIGKTRLAIQVASQLVGRYPDGVFFVPLAPVTSERSLVTAIASAIQFTYFEDGDPEPQLIEYLRAKHMLLLVDNFEHLLAGGQLLSSILAQAPGMKILATSRERLHLQEEWVYNIQGLSYPEGEPEDDLESYGAIALFVQSARHVQSQFRFQNSDMLHIQRICQYVEGMPLAVELAAAWSEMLTTEEIADEVERSLDFLSAAAQNLPRRHHSVRAVFESSWQQLTSNEQNTLLKLSVFRAGFTPPAAQAVAQASLPLLRVLLNKSLIQRDETGRYAMHELLRQFTHDKLAASVENCESTYRSYANYYVSYLQQLEPALKNGGQIEALDQIESEIDNLRSAWNWAVSSQSLDIIQSLLGGLLAFYFMRSRLDESAELFGHASEELQAASLTEEESYLLGTLKVVHALILLDLGQYQQGRQVAQEAIELLAHAESEDLAFTFILLGLLHTWPAEGREEAMFWLTKGMEMLDGSDQWWEISLGYRGLGEVYHHAIDYDKSAQYYQKSLEISRRIGDRYGEGAALRALGEVAYTLGNYPESERLRRESLTIHELVGELHEIAWGLDRLGTILSVQGKYDQAVEVIERSLGVSRQLGRRDYEAYDLFNAGVTALAERRYQDAERIFQQSLAIHDFADVETSSRGWVIQHLSQIALETGDITKAKQLVETCEQIFQESNHPWGKSAAWHVLGQIAIEQGDFDQAEDYLHSSLKMAWQVKSIMQFLRHLVGWAKLLVTKGQPEQALELLALIQNHHASWQETKYRAAQLASEIETKVPSDAAEAAKRRGEQLEIESVMKQFR